MGFQSCMFFLKKATFSWVTPGWNWPKIKLILCNPQPELLLSENYLLYSSTLSSKYNRSYSKKCGKTSISAIIGLYDWLWRKWGWKSKICVFSVPDTVNSISIGWQIMWPPVIQRKERNLTTYWDFPTTDIPSRTKLVTFK